jgi:hypothetical protein
VHFDKNTPIDEKYTPEATNDKQKAHAHAHAFSDNK